MVASSARLKSQARAAHRKWINVVTVAMAVHNQKGELVLMRQQVFTLKLSTKG